ncbi:amidohydrolase family protein [Pseudenhygromyxa sp. WMMC2535]|uniref:amidohydrolase family protein n=1 Tax=Pseudenhygromyxa sp. WMMC2535 TaxID=2712867 RepID=UPI0015528E71|nr:amidohydrolase family protein [Pseudenhygromyxa sp. WMMC2535]NVB38531.1 amidohydrolase family protein [Pseudenhygromyxa sp. WMMC2535]
MKRRAFLELGLAAPSLVASMSGCGGRSRGACPEPPAPAPGEANQVEPAALEGRSWLLTGARVPAIFAPQGEEGSYDLRVVEGRIVSIERAPSSAGAGEPGLDLRGCWLLPGFVDTHFHLWNSLARGADNSQLGGFYPSMGALAKVWTPAASALGVELGLAECVASGITTVNNWAHNVRSPEHAAAELDAQLRSGVRGRFSCGYSQSLGEDEIMDLDTVAAMLAQVEGIQGSLIDVGIAARGPDRSAGEVWRAEWDRARALGVPITAHVASKRAAADEHNIPLMYEEGRLGPDVQLVHATHARPEDYAMLAEAGSPVFISPWTETAVGYGFPGLLAMIDAGVKVGLSVDNLVLASRADFFEVMKLSANLLDALGEAQRVGADARVLGWATSGGGEALGIPGVGRLEVGGPADIVALRPPALAHLGLDRAKTFTHHATTAWVDTVLIDGRVHKRGGKLTRIDAAELAARAQAMFGELAARAGL